MCLNEYLSKSFGYKYDRDYPEIIDSGVDSFSFLENTPLVTGLSNIFYLHQSLSKERKHYDYSERNCLTKIRKGVVYIIALHYYIDNNNK
jgi:hypothetical protein